MSNTNALASEYTKVIPARFVTKRDGTPMACMTCGTPLALGAAFAATKGDGWHSYCERCAADTKAQIAGLIARIETLVAPLGANVPANVTNVVQYLTPQIEAILAGTGGDAAEVKSGLLQVRKWIGEAKAATLPAPVRTNNYGGKCVTCTTWVAEKKGRIEKVNGRWATFHLDGECVTAKVATPVADLENGLYLHDDGTVRKVYTTRNERQAVKVLVPQSTGEVNADGTPKLRGSFQYVQGGVRIVRDALAAGTAHVLTEAEAGAFGRQFSFCVNCGLYLDDDRSLAAGYGPTCAENNHWFYPTYEEASKILGRPAMSNKAKGGAPVVEAPAPAPTAVCELCDETITSFEAMWFDTTGSETCSGDDATGPDYHHQPLV